MRTLLASTLLLFSTLSASDLSPEISINAVNGIDAVIMVSAEKNSEPLALAKSSMEKYGLALCNFSLFVPTEEEIRSFGLLYKNDMKVSPVNILERGNKKFTLKTIPAISDRCFGPKLSLDQTLELIRFIKVIKLSLAKGYERIWILKEDVEISSDPRFLSEKIKELEILTDGNWDILFTTPPSNGNRVEDRIDSTILNPKRVLNKIDLDPFWYMGIPEDSSSLVLSRSGMQKIIAHYQAHGIYFPFETECLYIPNIHIFSLKTRLFSKKAAPVVPAPVPLPEPLPVTPPVVIVPPTPKPPAPPAPAPVVQKKKKKK